MSVNSTLYRKASLSGPLLGVSGDEDMAREQMQQELTFWARVLECAHDEETCAVALLGYQFTALQLVFGQL